jgi:hypothetical protein
MSDTHLVNEQHDDGAREGSWRLGLLAESGKLSNDLICS